MTKQNKQHQCLSEVSLRIAVAGEKSKVTGEYFERVKNFPGKNLKTSPKNFAF